jgi:hypothetical protein
MDKTVLESTQGCMEFQRKINLKVFHIAPAMDFLTYKLAGFLTCILCGITCAVTDVYLHRGVGSKSESLTLFKTIIFAGNMQYVWS